MAPPTPRLNGSRVTWAPAAWARVAVSSLEPSSTTSTSTSGSSPRTSVITSAIESASFQAGMMIRTRLLLIIGWLPLGEPVQHLRPQQRDVLGERSGLLLQPADLPAQVHADQQQEDDAEEQHEADAGGEAERDRHLVDHRRHEGDRDHDDAHREPEDRVLLLQLPPPEQLDHEREHG